MKKIAVLIVLLVSLLFSGCALKAASEESLAGRGLMEIAPAEAPSVMLDAANSVAGKSDYASAPVATERLVIKNANISIVVADPTNVVNAIAQLANGMGGFVVTSNIYQTYYNDVEYNEGSITIRIPAAQLDTALSQIRAMVEDPKKDISSENISGEDVTSTVVDLESRLKNYQATQTQLLNFMDEAKTTKDALDVLNQLTYIQEQIELLQGQIKYYRESAALSAIYVTVQPKLPVAPITASGWKALEVIRNAAQALVDVAKVVFTILVYLVFILGPFVVVFFFIYWLVWLGKKKQGWTRKGLKFYRPGYSFTPPPMPEPMRPARKK